MSPIETNVLYANVGAQLPPGVGFGGGYGALEVEALPNSNGGKYDDSDYKPLRESGKLSRVFDQLPIYCRVGVVGLSDPVVRRVCCWRVAVKKRRCKPE
jgi:hypothetical protein